MRRNKSKLDLNLFLYPCPSSKHAKMPFGVGGVALIGLKTGVSTSMLFPNSVRPGAVYQHDFSVPMATASGQSVPFLMNWSHS